MNKKIIKYLYACQCLSLLILLSCDHKILRPIENDNSIYGFEIDNMGWEVSTNNDQKAITAAHQTNVTSFMGSGSLMIVVDLEGGNSPKNAGEVGTKWFVYHPSNIKPPLNLMGVEISAWIYAPKGAGGPLDGPKNIISLVAFNANFKYKSGYETIVENEWFKVSFISDTIEHMNEHLQPGFDPTAITAITIIIDVQSDSSYHYNGCLFIDTVDW